MSNRFYVATRKGLFTVDRTGSHWAIGKADFLGDSVPMMLPDSRDGTIYAALKHEQFGPKIHRSLDGGNTWEECGTPAYPPKPEGIEDLDPVRKKPVEWRLTLIWALEAGHADQPGMLWCGTIPGGLFRSPDRGSTWEIVQPLWDNPKRKEWFGGGAELPGIHSIAVDPRDRRQVTVGVSCGGVWKTNDGGATWNCRAEGMWAAYMPPDQQKKPNIQDPHRLVLCPAKADCLWVQHHNAVFKSTDGSASWQEVKNVQPSNFGFAVAVHPRDANTAWLVPAIKDERRIPVDGKVVVTRTRDGGANWEVLRTGLPQKYAYDLTFRHALDVDDTGNSLAFGSTTGNLWVSDNSGDSWQCIAQHLPPIYCVRFAK